MTSNFDDITTAPCQIQRIAPFPTRGGGVQSADAPALPSATDEDDDSDAPFDDLLPDLYVLPVLTRTNARDMIRRLHGAILRTGYQHDLVGDTFHDDDEELHWLWQARYRPSTLPSTHVAQLLTWAEDFLAFMVDDYSDGVGGVAGQAALADVSGFMNNVRMALKETAYTRLHRWPPVKDALHAAYCGNAGEEGYRAAEEQWFVAHLPPGTRPPTFEAGLIVLAQPTREEWAAEARRGVLFAIPQEWSGYSFPFSVTPMSAEQGVWA